jgi:hypothetical protein
MTKRKERFELFRLSLLERTSPNLFVDMSEDRETVLRREFGKARTFSHYLSTFHYVPHPQIPAGGMVMGAIGRAIESEENLPPDAGLAEATRPTWKASVFALDPMDHIDGQKAALEDDRRVGGCLALMTALVHEINLAESSRFQIEVNPIFDASSFWTWAAEQNGQITEVFFDVVAPNGLFSTNGTLKDELKSTREQTGAEEVVIGLKGSEGLDVNSSPVVDAVAYTEQSGGRIKAKSKNGKRFNSTQRPKTTILEGENSGSETLILRAARAVSDVFGRRE